MMIKQYQAAMTDLKKKRIPTAVKEVVTAMLDKKAEQVVVLKLKDINEITDFMVICTGNSSKQNNAIADEIQRHLLDEFKMKTYGSEGEREGNWILLDYIDFIIHIFSEENRKKYALEKLWMDAKRYNFYTD